MRVGRVDVIRRKFFNADLKEQRLEIGHFAWMVMYFCNRAGSLQSLVSVIFQERILQRLPLFTVCLSHLARKLTYSSEICLTFRNADRAARIQDIERVVAFENIIVRGDDQAL